MSWDGFQYRYQSQSLLLHHHHHDDASLYRYWFLHLELIGSLRLLKVGYVDGANDKKQIINIESK